MRWLEIILQFLSKNTHEYVILTAVITLVSIQCNVQNREIYKEQLKYFIMWPLMSSYITAPVLVVEFELPSNQKFMCKPALTTTTLQQWICKLLNLWIKSQSTKLHELPISEATDSNNHMLCQFQVQVPNSLFFKTERSTWASSSYIVAYRHGFHERKVSNNSTIESSVFPLHFFLSCTCTLLYNSHLVHLRMTTTAQPEEE
jgi:hypothetical protein